MSEIVINDAIMGSGKTTRAIERMKKSKRNFLYVTPFLNEVKRVLEDVPGTYEPKVTSSKSIRGEVYVSYKRDNLLNMANKKLNIVTTHSLFSNLHRRDYEFFKDYDLILDEVIMPIKLIEMTPDDINIAFNEGLLVLNENSGEVSYTGDNYNGKFYAKLKSFCDTSNVVFVNNRLLVWAFPPEIFSAFNSVTILTYLFEGSLLSSYFKYYNIDYTVNNINKEKEALLKCKIDQLLNIYEGRGNNYGEFPTAFSKNWLENKNSKDLKKIKTTVANLIDRHFRTPSSKNVFTTFKKMSSKLKGKGYSRGFIPVNERATNMYAHNETMIYLANRYLNPNIIDFFRQGGIEVDQEKWALAELVQWVWRGSIRNYQKMNLYIPSKRMRNLLRGWLNESNCNEVKKVA